MTLEEAITELCIIQKVYVGMRKEYQPCVEALQIAIEALKAEQTEPQRYVINPQEPTNDEKCFECDDFFTCGGQCNKIKDEPQTDCAWK